MHTVSYCQLCWFSAVPTTKAGLYVKVSAVCQNGQGVLGRFDYNIRTATEHDGKKIA